MAMTTPFTPSELARAWAQIRPLDCEDERDRTDAMTRRLLCASDEVLLRALYPHLPTAWVARALEMTVRSVYAHARRRGLQKTAEYLASPHACRLRRDSRIGASFRFLPGHVPANKGKKMPPEIYAKCRATMFKKGGWSTRNAAMYKPIGTLRIGSKDGYLEQKITDAGRGGQRWRAYHRVVWELAHGPIPVGHVVAFKPGRFSTDPAQITADALELLTLQQNIARNTIHNYPPELRRLMQLRGTLNRQINQRARNRTNKAQESNA